ncbi:oligosaccharide flippase family protein [Novosphingobium sp. BL-8H]|uniref:oligosaccharide flippase family protein n=1 Tax=Novosphingobium sp. BL-8H TaxID=3127640 RepID=UPI003756B23F
MPFSNAAQAAETGSPPRPTLTDRIKALALRDTNVVVVAVILNNLLRAVSGMILTRLLVPEVFGISGIIGSIQFTVTLATDLGFQPFVVRHQNGDDPRFLDTVWTAALVRSILLGLTLVALAQPLAMLLEKPELTPVIAASSLTFLFDGLASTTLLTALRRRMVLKLSIIDIAAQVVQIAVSAVLAYFWRSYWAILVGMLSNGAFRMAMSYVAFDDSVRRLRLDRETLRELWSFARYVTGSSIIFLIISQCDKLVLAKMMPLDDFGFYVLAGNLASAPLGFAAAYNTRVLYPAYAQMWREGEADLKARFYARRRVPALLYVFASGGIIGAAPTIVRFLYTARYAEAAVYLQILGISSLLALSSYAAHETLTAVGNARAFLEANTAKLAWLVLAGGIGFLSYGAFGLIVAVGLMELPSLLLRWQRLSTFDLLDLRQELLILAAAPAGIAAGLLVNAIAARILG